MSLDTTDLLTAERQRIEAEYGRREREISPDLYAPWQPAEVFISCGKKRVATKMLHDAGVFPKGGEQCLEVGFGRLGWLGDLATWGVSETNMHGIDLNPSRVDVAHQTLPMADLRIGDAAGLPWDDEGFQLVIASNVFTSILDTNVRSLVAREIVRVLAPGGALLWYDSAFNNPKNSQLRRVSRGDLKKLFPELRGRMKRVTLAPPLVRFTVPWSWTLATVLEAIPLLRTHLLAVLIK